MRERGGEVGPETEEWFRAGDLAVEDEVVKARWVKRERRCMSLEPLKRC